jgi:hypothetical protein
MNNYCYKFNHNFVLPTKEIMYPDGVKNLQSSLDKNLLDPKIHEILRSVGINVRWIELNYKIAQPPNTLNSIYGTIHADGEKFDDRAKINFVIGGTDSQMLWHDFVDEAHSEINVFETSIGTSVIRPKSWRDRTKVVHRESFRAAVVNAGRLHSIENTKDERICIQLIIEDTDTKQRLDFYEAVKRFQSIEHLINLDNSLSL